MNKNSVQQGFIQTLVSWSDGDWGLTRTTAKYQTLCNSVMVQKRNDKELALQLEQEMTLKISQTTCHFIFNRLAFEKAKDRVFYT